MRYMIAVVTERWARLPKAARAGVWALYLMGVLVTVLGSIGLIGYFMVMSVSPEVLLVGVLAIILFFICYNIVRDDIPDAKPGRKKHKS